MRKFKAYAPMIFTVPASALMFIVLSILALGGMVVGYGFFRTFTVFAEEFKDALIYARVRLDVGKRK